MAQLVNGNERDASYTRKIYEIVATIPAGKVATYGQLSEMLGGKLDAREVGHIMACAGGHDLPAHRVVNRSGTLAPDYAFGGQEKQQAMLEAEGVTFLSEGRVDMARHWWGACEQLSF